MRPALLLFIASVIVGPCTARECNNQQQCVDLSSCQEWTNKKVTHSNKKEFNSLICGFSGLNPQICCDERAMVNQEIGTSRGNKLYKQKQNTVAECGIVQSKEHAPLFRIANGDNVARAGAWPWMARLIYDRNTKEPETTICSGTLVSSRHVVTAAHCVVGELVAVVLGELDITTEYDCLLTSEECGADGEEGRQCLKEGRCADKSKTYPIARTRVHEQYSARGGRQSFPIFDIAILELKTPVMFSDYIQPVCLPNPATSGAASQPMVLTGWGNTAPGFTEYRSATILQEIPGLQERALEECRSDLRLPLQDHQMCVWSSVAQACTGDSGGPVARRSGETWELVGVVSFGRVNCGSSSPLVATRVEEQAVLSWLREQVADVPTLNMPRIWQMNI